MRILDFHVHYNGDASLAPLFVERWRAGGISKACVFATNANDGSHPSVRDLTALAEKFPEFVIPFGYINLGHEDGAAIARVHHHVMHDVADVHPHRVFPAPPRFVAMNDECTLARSDE